MSDGMLWASSKPISGGIMLEEIADFRDRIRIGEKLQCRIASSEGIMSNTATFEKPRTCHVKKKYTYHALTDKGCFQWQMLAIWNRSK